jgi:hypothetical protein
MTVVDVTSTQIALSVPSPHRKATWYVATYTFIIKTRVISEVGFFQYDLHCFQEMNRILLVGIPKMI